VHSNSIIAGNMAWIAGGLKSVLGRASGSARGTCERASWVRSESSYASFMGSWKPTDNPGLAKSRLVKLRKNYEKEVKELRKQYFYEMEAKKLEDQVKREAELERMKVAREERKAAKRERSQLLATQRQQQSQEFREMLQRERAKKAEIRMRKEKSLEQKRAREKELIWKKSSLWIDEKDLDRRIVEAMVDTTPL